MVQKEFLSKFDKMLFNHLPEPEYIVLSITTAFSNLQLNMKMKTQVCDRPYILTSLPF